MLIMHSGVGLSRVFLLYFLAHVAPVGVTLAILHTALCRLEHARVSDINTHFT